MRKVKFLIDDNKYFINQFDGKPELQKHFEEKDSFQAVFTLYGCGQNIDRYTLTDYNGNKIDINPLNGYQNGVILNDCYAYFEGRQYQNGATEPCGVINIEETETEGEPKQCTFQKLKTNI